MSIERPVVFSCEGESLVGILHEGSEDQSTGVVIVVGGPQYRVGSHRQFVVTARYLAEAGYPVFRFDFRGMGDSTGEALGFQHVTPDIAAAIDSFKSACPSVSRIVSLGLCDGASAICMSMAELPDSVGAVLINPWVHTEKGEAKAYVSSYYLQRVLQRSFWNKLLEGKLSFWQSIRDAARTIILSWSPSSSQASDGAASEQFVDKMLVGIAGFTKRILIVISGRDLTATQFVQLSESDRRWKSATLRPSVQTVLIPNADHTFSSSKSAESMCGSIEKWLRVNDSCVDVSSDTGLT